jgi:hypothetical protein
MKWNEFIAWLVVYLLLIVFVAWCCADDWNKDCFGLIAQADDMNSSTRGVRVLLGFVCCLETGGPGVFYPLGSSCSFLYDLDLSGPFPDGAEITLSDYATLQNNFSTGWLRLP